MGPDCDVSCEVQSEGGLGAARGCTEAVNPMGTRRLVQMGGGSQGWKGIFGSQHKSRRGGVRVEGKGVEGERRGVDESASLFCCANVTSDCYG